MLIWETISWNKSSLFFQRLFLLCLFLNYGTFTTAQIDTVLNLTQYTTVDGLSSNYTGRSDAIVQDEIGNLWIGTDNGINKFDGNTFVHYKDDSTSINYIRGTYFIALCKDKNGNIWTGSFENGVSRINPYTNEIKNYRFDSQDSLSLPANRINHIFTDQYNELWINVHRVGLCKVIDEEKGQFRLLDMMKGVPAKEDVDNYGNIIAGAVPDPINKDIMWLAALHGICKFDTQKETFDFFPFEEYEYKEGKPTK